MRPWLAFGCGAAGVLGLLLYLLMHFSQDCQVISGCLSNQLVNSNIFARLSGNLADFLAQISEPVEFL